MKFSTRHDVAAPVKFVFARASDFNGFERQALRRGIEIERTDEKDFVGVGMCWKAGFSFRGKPRKVPAELTQFSDPNGLLIESTSNGIVADFELEFLPLSRNQTRMRVGLTLSPKTLPARLLVQSLKFAKGSLDERFKNRIVQFGSDIEDRYRRDREIRDA